ncbi:MAG: PIN domain-containing protein [Haloarculaceae archaeon]
MMVLLDTNALMMPVEVGVRLFDELDRVVGEADLAVPAAVVAELRALADGAGEEARAARVGHDLAERCSVVEHEADYADDAVVELGPAYDYVVTNDRALRERLHAQDVRTIGVRGRNTLAIHQRASTN